MSANQKAPAKGTIDPLMLGLGIGVIWLLSYLFWSRYHTQIATAYSWVRIAEFSAFVVLSHWLSGVLGAGLAMAGIALRWLATPLRKYATPLMVVGLLLIGGWLMGGIFGRWFTFFVASDKSLIGWDHMTMSSLHANLFTAFCCVVPLAVWIARRSIATNPTNHKHFGKTKAHDLHSFTDLMGETYPHAALFRKLNLTKRSINDGKYRMADTEKQFVLKHQLMDRGKADGEYTVNRERAATVFRAQMGKLWRARWADLSRTELMLLAIVVPRIAATDAQMSDADYDEALKTTERLLADCWQQSKAYDPAKDAFPLNTDMARAALRRYAGSRTVKAAMKRHAYVNTILYAMIQDARSLGVLQAAEVRWLRVLDRRLWLLVDNVGRQVAFTEVAGVVSHYLSEVARKRSSERPLVDGAVKGLLEAVESFKFTEDEIAEIERTITGPKQDVIDPKAIEKPKTNLMVFVRCVGHGASKDLFEVVILGEDGKVMYEARCKPAVSVEEIKDTYGLDSSELEQLLTAPTAEEVRIKIMEHCTKQAVVCYGPELMAVVKGVERAASSVTDLQTDTSHDLVMAAIEDGAADPEKHPQISSAHGGATLLRQLWVEREKRVLRAQAEARRS